MCDVPKNWTGGLNSLIYTTLSNETPLVVHGARKDVDNVLGFINTDEEFADLHVYNMTVYNTGMIKKKYKMTESVVAILAHKHLEVCLCPLLQLQNKSILLHVPYNVQTSLPEYFTVRDPAAVGLSIYVFGLLMNLFCNGNVQKDSASSGPLWILLSSSSSRLAAHMFVRLHHPVGVALLSLATSVKQLTDELAVTVPGQDSMGSIPWAVIAQRMMTGHPSEENEEEEESEGIPLPSGICIVVCVYCTIYICILQRTRRKRKILRQKRQQQSPRRHPIRRLQKSKRKSQKRQEI